MPLFVVVLSKYPDVNSPEYSQISTIAPVTAPANADDKLTVIEVDAFEPTIPAQISESQPLPSVLICFVQLTFVSLMLDTVSPGELLCVPTTAISRFPLVGVWDNMAEMLLPLVAVPLAAP